MKFFYILLGLAMTITSLPAQQQGIGQQCRQRLPWNGAGRSQYQQQMSQNKQALQQQQQSRWMQSQQAQGQQGGGQQGGNQPFQAHRQRLPWNSEGRSQYQQQMSQNKQALQQQQQSRWMQSQQAPSGPGEGQQGGDQTFQPHHQRGSWNASSRGQYQQQMNQNQQALQQQQQSRWKQ